MAKGKQMKKTNTMKSSLFSSRPSLSADASSSSDGTKSSPSPHKTTSPQYILAFESESSTPSQKSTTIILYLPKSLRRDASLSGDATYDDDDDSQAYSVLPLPFASSHQQQHPKNLFYLKCDFLHSKKPTLFTLVNHLHRSGVVDCLHHVRFHTAAEKWIPLSRPLHATLKSQKGLYFELNSETFIIDYDNQKLKEAKEMFIKKKFKDSIHLYKEVYKRYPHLNFVFNNLAMAHLKLHEAKTAIHCATNFLSVKQSSSPANLPLHRTKAVYRIRMAYLQLGIYNLLAVKQDPDFESLQEEFSFLRIFNLIQDWRTDMNALKVLDGTCGKEIMLSSLDNDLNCIQNMHMRTAFKCFRQFIRWGTVDVGQKTVAQNKTMPICEDIIILIFASCELMLPLCASCRKEISAPKNKEASRMVHGALKTPQLAKMSTSSPLMLDFFAIYESIRNYTAQNQKQIPISYPVCEKRTCEDKIRKEYLEEYKNVDIEEQDRMQQV